MPIPKQASWLVREMVEARNSVATIHIQLRKNNNIIRQLYLAMMGQLPRVEWKMLMFGNEARAKAKFTMCLYFQERMLTSDILNKWGMQVDMKCIMCKVHDENRKHIFIECEYAKSVWTKLLKWMQRQPIWATSWDQHRKWAAENAKGKSSKAGVFRMVYAEAIHEIWNERNHTIFEKQSKKAEELARNIACICNVRATNQNRQLIQKFQF
ncbi:uncharacterized protein LOC107793101 [Nicotiana tabacum]|uniref:Uncharacterized protein LOC107793101 n=2 Tax=Nicotiana TaxID=4085 RepID=A0A1S4A2S8_TOBAC|nr:PREDICTED: uncharacterized protein LOC104217219 [Nicotiana sylvestris]XP_016470876.1 PREDICTED: uncharacterized protein LOC107793101 [Nicotiana tabacum]